MDSAVQIMRWSAKRIMPICGRLASVLNEAVMGFLALAALGLGLAPLVFELAPGVERGFDAAEWAIVGMFALEYAAKFARCSLLHNRTADQQFQNCTKSRGHNRISPLPFRNVYPRAQ